MQHLCCIVETRNVFALENVEISKKENHIQITRLQVRPVLSEQP